MMTKKPISSKTRSRPAMMITDRNVDGNQLGKRQDEGLRISAG